MPFVRLTREDEPPLDPLIKALTPQRAEKDILEYTRLLDAGASEQAVQEFLANHSYFFAGLLRLNGASPLYSKVRLGAQFELDFACFDAGSVGPEWRLMEIEAPTQHLFKKNGDPSAALTHAMRQVQDSQAWVHDNLDYARKLLPHIEYPMGYVFLGRRIELSGESPRKRLRLLNKDHRQSLEIHSLDWFANTARGVVDTFIPREGGGTWRVPMKALTHADLSAGLPPFAMRYMASFFSAPFSPYPDDFLRNRESKYYGKGDEENV